MSVYVDPLEVQAASSERLRSARSCRMYADTPEELYAMAARLGLRRGWVQELGGLPCFELVTSKREAAVERGARQHTREQRAEWLRSRTRGAMSLGLFDGDEPAEKPRNSGYEEGR